MFRHRDYRLFLVGRFLWGVALHVETVAVAWLVYELTNDPLALGLIGLAQFLPTVPLSLVTGAVADHFDRRRVLLVSYCTIALSALTLVATCRMGLVWPIYLSVVVIGVARAFKDDPFGLLAKAADLASRFFGLFRRSGP